MREPARWRCFGRVMAARSQDHLTWWRLRTSSSCSPLRSQSNCSVRMRTLLDVGSRHPRKGIRHPPRELAVPPMQPPSAMAGTWSRRMKWRLESGEALVIFYRVSKGSPYVNKCLNNRWSESIDMITRQRALGSRRSMMARFASGSRPEISKSATGWTRGALRVVRHLAPEPPEVTVIHGRHLRLLQRK